MTDPNEAQTRKQYIDSALATVGWDVANPDQVGIEIPADSFQPQAWQKLAKRLKDEGVPYEVKLPSGVCDYVLYRENGEILGVVEAKRTSIDPRLGQAQTRFYVEEIAKRQSFAPFGFMSNGLDVYFYEVGRAVARQVYGFFSRADLERLLYLRQAATPLTQAPIGTDITDRVYQQEAIRRTCEAFEKEKKRKALLVMATGTGKTRTAMSLIDIFLRTNQARKILFVADRDALTQQALEDGFQVHLPAEPCIRIHTQDAKEVQGNRLFAVTLQTLNNCFRQFTPGFFDLIVFDEVHRSIFNKWNEPLQYFDARMIGLTATPADFIDRNTFLAFDCFDDRPTFLYSYEDAIADDYLVDYTLYQAQTRFQLQGIHGAELTEEERNLLIERGIDPDELDYAGTDLEREVTNRDTLRNQWREIWDVCFKDESGNLPGKTIVFALSQKHALRLDDAFNAVHPEHPDLAEVITYQTRHARRAIKRFKEESWPRIAISVDMLETGLDVPEAVNLVFMRPVHSRIKLEQMIGRGTRPQATCRHLEWLPDRKKTEFLIIDFWDNDFDREAEEVVSQSLPVLVSLFNTRLKLLAHHLDDQASPEARQVIADLRAMIDRIPQETFEVRRRLHEIGQAWDDHFWRYLTPDKVKFLRLDVGPLLRYAPDVDVAAETFAHKVERFKLARVEKRDTANLVSAIAEDVSYLPAHVHSDEATQASAALGIAPQRLQQASVVELTALITDLAPQMKYRAKTRSGLLELDLPDAIELRGYVILDGIKEPVYAEEYRRQVEDRVLDLVAGHPTVEALARGEVVTDTQLLDLERTLRRKLSGEDLHLTEANIRRAWRNQGIEVDSLLAFLRYLLALDNVPDYAEIVTRRFSDYLAERPFTADQVRFLRAVQSEFIKKRRLHLADLYDPPLTAFGQNAVERLFTPREVEDVLEFTQTLTVV
jgi:type I restriction enzyme, R subunit